MNFTPAHSTLCLIRITKKKILYYILLPNACLCTALAIYIDNGLGEYITRLGLAKPFLTYAEWTETVGAGSIQP